MLSCPHCGAAVQQDARQCIYCQGLLQTVACPKCMAMMFAGSEFCPGCGARTEVVTTADQTENACPRCAAPGIMLEHVTLGGSLVEECRQCGGMWVDARRFEHLCTDAETEARGSGTMDGGENAIPHVAPERQIRYIHCPQCDQIMNRVNFGMQSGVVIDVCKGHGIWLDKDELKEIIAYIRAGGMKQTREAENQRLQSQKTQTLDEIQAVGRSYGTSQYVGDHGDGTGLAGTILSVALDLLFKK